MSLALVPCAYSGAKTLEMLRLACPFLMTPQCMLGNIAPVMALYAAPFAKLYY